MSKFKRPKSIAWCGLIGSIVFWLGEILLVVHQQLQDSIVVTFGLYLLTVATVVFLLQYPMPQAAVFSYHCHALANFTYYIHPLIISVLSFAATIIGGDTIPETIMFILVVFITLVAGLFSMRYKKCTDG